MLIDKLFGKKKETDNWKTLDYYGMEFKYESSSSDYDSHSLVNPCELEKLHLEFDHELKSDMNILKNKDGDTSLMIYVSVPTFDSGDREWDSYRKLYLIPKGRKITAYVVAGGYRLSRIQKYNNIRCKNEKAEQILKEAGIFRISKW